MDRISDILSEIYQKYLPKFKELGIILSFDFPDTTITTSDKERVKKDIEKSVKSTLGHTKNSEVKIIVRKGFISIVDPRRVIKKTLCKKISTEHITVKSRVGFGTTITINF